MNGFGGRGTMCRVAALIMELCGLWLNGGNLAHLTQRVEVLKYWGLRCLKASLLGLGFRVYLDL